MLLDTSGLLALLHEDETQHFAAVTAYEQATSRVTHSYVLAEFVPLATVRGVPRSSTLEFSKRLLATPAVSVTWVSESLHRRAVDLLSARRDKDYSLCDAVSFVLMREHKVLDALTSDRHFEQEGFRRLLS